MKFQCRTQFDITATGITGHYKGSRTPFKDLSGQNIATEEDWNRARNQQRNWETLTQIISLRTQIFNLDTPKQVNNQWEFEFSVETPSIFGTDINPVLYLYKDADLVPMLGNLNNTVDLPPILITHGVNQNIWFELMPINSL